MRYIWGECGHRGSVCCGRTVRFDLWPVGEQTTDADESAMIVIVFTFRMEKAQAMPHEKLVI
jgi:hypothetical protein